MEVILKNQATTGAFVASPAFSHYQYSWLRDGTFIAHSLDLIGQTEAAHRFYQWVHHTILKHKETILENKQMDTRFTLDGEVVNEEWGNYQLDGYGTWLWGLKEHLKLTNESVDSFQESVDLTLQYLANRWNDANYDCWEENSQHRHPATLAALYAGVKDFNDELATKIKDTLLTEGVMDGHFTKHVGFNEVDSSLLWISTPFKVVEANHPIMKKTVELIEERLLFNSGVHRYPQDEYYGGGQWLLLSAWLGWYYTEVGELDKAQKQLEWVMEQQDENGFYPEQVAHHLMNPEHYEEWIERWGAPANPLLWSHAMKIILEQKLNSVKEQ